MNPVLTRRSQQARLGTDSGFRELGYLILAVTKRDVRDGNARVEMQRDAGLDVRWVDAQEACSLNPTLMSRRESRGTANGSHSGETGMSGRLSSHAEYRRLSR